MLSLATSAYMKYIKRNIFVVLQLTVMLIVMLVTVTMIREEYSWYRPVAEFGNNSGLAITATGYHGETKEEITKGMEKVESIMTWGFGNLMISKDEEVSNFLAYDDQLIENFKPELSSGEWLDKYSSEDEIIDIVVSENPYGWKEGNQITLAYYDANGEIHSVKANVRGVLKEGISLVGSNIGSSQLIKTDYRDLYSTYSYEQSEMVLVLMKEKQAIAQKIPMTYNQKFFVSFESDITESQIRNNEYAVKMNIGGYGASDTCIINSLDQFMKNSKHEMLRTVLVYLPIFICILCITIISIINVCTLNLADDIRQNAVFSVLGLPWKKNSLFSLIQIIITTVMSLVLAMLVILIIRQTKLNEYIYIKINLLSGSLLFVLIVAICLIYYFVASRTLRKHKPVELLKSMI